MYSVTDHPFIVGRKGFIITELLLSIITILLLYLMFFDVIKIVIVGGGGRFIVTELVLWSIIIIIYRLSNMILYLHKKHAKTVSRPMSKKRQ